MKNDKLYVKHILMAIDLIEKFIKDVDQGQFKKNLMINSAVVRQLEIIGEAAGKISDSFKDKHPEISWKSIISMRNKLIHEYFGVDLNMVWDTVVIDIPYIKDKIKIQN